MTTLSRSLLASIFIAASAAPAYSALPPVVADLEYLSLLPITKAKSPKEMAIATACKHPQEVVAAGDVVFYRSDNNLSAFQIPADDYVTLTFIQIGIAPSSKDITRVLCPI